MKTLLLAFTLAFVTACNAADTTLVLKPKPAQVEAAAKVGNKLCPVTGEEIGSMGGGRTVLYQGKAVQLCCAGCVKTFGKDPAKYLAIAEKGAKAPAAAGDSSMPAHMEHGEMEHEGMHHD